ncbi:hypothetical protein UlMin_030704 [Ulmus minor]
MQSRMAVIARRSNLVFSSKHVRRGLATSYGTCTVDPEAHRLAYLSGEPEDTKNVAEAKPAKPQTEEPRPTVEGTEPLSPPKLPHAVPPRLESTGVNQPLDSNFQQKRRLSTALNDVSCAGLDGSPWPEDKGGRKSDRDEQQMDDKDYFEHHKASPLSEIEVADTRKPITRATDGTADTRTGSDLVGWLPEQLDTAEDSLRRAMEIWKQNAMRGDPDSPHGRVLRALRGESF